MRPSGALGQTIPLNSYNWVVTGAIGATGVLWLTGIALLAGDTITNISYRSGSTAAVNPANWWFALYNEDLTLRGQTADQTTTAWGTSTTKTLALTTPSTITTSGMYYVGVMVKADTIPTMLAVTWTTTAPQVFKTLNGSSTTGLTDTAPATAGAITLNAVAPYAYVT
jgi:hypothetical protein